MSLDKIEARDVASDDGFALVPRRPTQAMLDASWHAIVRASAESRMRMELATSREAHDEKAIQRWNAMLAAAQSGSDPSYAVQAGYVDPNFKP